MWLGLKKKTYYTWIKFLFVYKENEIKTEKWEVWECIS